MNHDSYDDSYIRGILNTVKTIAMVGASAKDNRPSYFAFKYLLERGYNMIPINPGLAGKDLLGRKIYARLADIPEPIDMVDIFRASQLRAADRRRRRWRSTRSRGDLDAARRPQRRGRRAGGSERHEGRDEPLPQDRIRPPLLRDRLDRASTRARCPRSAPRCSAAAFSACRSTVRPALAAAAARVVREDEKSD